MSILSQIANQLPRTLLNGFGRWLPVIIWCGIIFAFSHQSDARLANLQPTNIAKKPGFLLFGIYDFDNIVSKGSHVVLFGILAILLFHATRRYWLAGALSFLYAITDEWHQSFVPSRTPKVTGVGYDMLGVILALLAIAIALRWYRTRQSSR